MYHGETERGTSGGTELILSSGYARQEPIEILKSAIEEYRPVAIFAGFSGGHDSLVSTDWTMRNAPTLTDAPVRALHINTGIGIEATRKFVRDICKQRGWPLWERHANKGEYESFVKAHGFPGPAQHARMYQRLKERVVAAILREVKSHRMDKVMFVTGIYAAESRIRSGYQRAVSKMGAAIWVNPLYWKEKAWFDEYRKEHSLPINPVKELYGHSGECLCGAFADHSEAALLKRHFPADYAEIERLEKLAADNGKPWKWGDSGPTQDYLDEQQGQSFFDFRPMCHGCGKSA